MAAGCTAGGGSSHSPSTPASSGAPPAAVSPARAITLAASRAQQVTSFTATLNVQATGSGKLTMAGSMSVRTKPTLYTDADFSTLSVSGQVVPGGMEEILTGNAVYVKLALLSQLSGGKQWIEIPFSELQQASGVNLSQLIQQLEGSNPLDQTQMLGAARDVRKVGTDTIDGVPTTHYTGSFPVSAGLAMLPAALRKSVEQQYKGASTVNFDVWLDAQQQVRRIITAEQNGSGRQATTINITGINNPVTASLPPAGEVASVPSGALGG